MSRTAAFFSSWVYSWWTPTGGGDGGADNFLNARNVFEDDHGTVLPGGIGDSFDNRLFDPVVDLAR